MLFWFGFVLITTAAGLAVYGAPRKTPGVFRVAVLLMFVGTILVFGDGVTEVNIPWLGSFKKVTAQAIADASAVSDLRKRVENQAQPLILSLVKRPVPKTWRKPRTRRFR